MSEGRDIIEPAQWPQRNDKRVPVLDMNFDPPRVDCDVGGLPCPCCGKKFFSRAAAGVRMRLPCNDGTRRESL